MKITIAYVTSRRTPHFEWFVESLAAQTTPEQRTELEVVFVDGRLWSPYVKPPVVYGPVDLKPASEEFHDPRRRSELKAIVAGRFEYLHIPPLPCAFQGPFRQTTRDFFCAGNTRNTAFIVAQHPYVVFCDDLSVLMPGWFDQVLHAARGEYVVCGAYKKVKELQYVTSPTDQRQLIVYSQDDQSIDSRWPHGSDSGVVQWHGSGLFGCSFGLPLEAALEVDGHDMATCSQGAEDYDVGIRLERAGWPVFYNRNMLTLESEEDHHTEESLPRIRKLVTEDRLPPGYTGERWSDHVMLNRLIRETDRILPLIGDNLRAVRARYQATGLVPIPREPQVDWRDGVPLSQL